jgi:hypothetical protein
MEGYGSVSSEQDALAPEFAEVVDPLQVEEADPGPFEWIAGGAASLDEFPAPDALSSQDFSAPAPDYDLSLEADYAGPEDTFDATALPDTGMDPMSASLGQAMPAPDELQDDLTLEDIVDDEMQKMDPYGTMDPYDPIGPYGSMPDPRMMDMPMNPFGPMPPGIGPMGPMMGPGT